MVKNSSSNNLEQARAPVYIPFKTFFTAIQVLREGLPAVLDRSVWPSFAGGLQSQTLGAFKFLELIDESGKVQPALTRLVNAKTDNEEKQILGEVIRSHYAEAVKLGEKNATFADLQESFRKYGVQRGTLERVVRFFLDACEYTDIKRSPHWAKARKSLRRVKRSTAPIKDKPGEGSSYEDTATNIKTVELRSGGRLSLSLSVDLITLSPEDRQWLFDIIDRFNKYGEAQVS